MYILINFSSTVAHSIFDLLKKDLQLVTEMSNEVEYQSREAKTERKGATLCVSGILDTKNSQSEGVTGFNVNPRAVKQDKTEAREGERL